MSNEVALPDRDGFVTLAQELDHPERGCLEVCVLRASRCAAIRYFKADVDEISRLYWQAVANPKVVMLGII